MKHCLWPKVFLSGATMADITGSAYVIDNDTIEIKGVYVRLNSIDTPKAFAKKVA